MVKKPILVVVLSLFLVVLAFVGWYATRTQTRGHETALTLYGNIDIREVDLAFNNSDRLEQILVQEGQRVEAGQLLATLQRARFEAQVSVAQARVAAQQATLAKFEAGSRTQEVGLSKSNVASASARWKDAQATFERINSLFDKKVVGRQALDDAEAELNAAAAALEGSRQMQALAIEGARREDIEQARALVQAEQAQLALQLQLLQDTHLLAPADGVIRSRILQPGDMATPQKPVLTLALDNPVWVRAYAQETELGKLVPGMLATISTDSYPDKNYRGWIGFISPTAEFTPKNVETTELRTRLVYQLRVYVCNPQQQLRLGMPATVTIELGQDLYAAGTKLPDCAQVKQD